jgi:hypothetical protein
MTMTIAVPDHPVHVDLVRRFTPPDPPPDRALLPHEIRERLAVSALGLTVARHGPVVVGGWVVCAGCTRLVAVPDDERAVWADAVYPCPTVRDIVGDHGYGLAIHDTDWADANTAMLRATGRSDAQVTQAAVLAAARAEDVPIYRDVAGLWPTGTEPTDEQETPHV